MDGLSLLDRARQAGLKVQATGGHLVITGPKRLRHLAQALMASKEEVLAELELEAWFRAVFPEARLDSSEFIEEPLLSEDFRIRRPEDLVGPDGGPPHRCWSCFSTRWWRLSGPSSLGRPWVCGVCHPPAVQSVEWFEGGRP